MYHGKTVLFMVALFTNGTVAQKHGHVEKLYSSEVQMTIFHICIYLLPFW